MTFQFFILPNSQSENIYIKIEDIVNNEILQFKTPFNIERDEWDHTKQRPKNIYLKKAKTVFERMNNLKLELKEYIREKSKTSLNESSLAKKIKQICKKDSEESIENSLLMMTTIYISSREKIICNSTLKRYKVFLKLIKRYEGYSLHRLYMHNLDANFINDFISFGLYENYSESTIYRTLHFIKTILNFAEKKGLRTSVRELNFRKEKQQRSIVSLSEKEILMIKKANVPDSLQTAKDWLIISCYTGQRFSDFMNFSIKQVVEIDNKICLSFVQQKTQKKVLLALHPTVIKIIEKNNNSFPKLLNMQQYNDDIKKVAELANINEIISARKRSDFRCKNIETEKFNVISSHVGRRSFATNFYGKIPTPLLMDATGHATEEMFQKYINPVNTTNVVSLSNYFDQCMRQ
ncbi:phage integrase SAM-like domain-containing protein [Chryseobacterium sp. M5]|uniref:phage integrase SAM-like domain-containing protein n=1 Tax=Chryseobacterium sp. M5 TaxID=3379128 RepID=UPI0038574FCB